MTGKEIFQCLARGERPPRFPFAPTIYEHAAAVIGKTPSELAQSAELLIKGQLEAYRLYGHDLVTVGVDIYNIEAEALGAAVRYSADGELPGIEGALLSDLEDMTALTIPDPEKDGRMPLLLYSAERINREIGGEAAISAAVVGPFTLSAILRGFENFIMDLLYDRESAMKLMQFSKTVAVHYAKAFIRRGVGVSINESWIAPPLLSPSMFREYAADMEMQMIRELKDAGLRGVALICGGDTIPIAPDLINTGTSLLMADYNTDQCLYKKLCAEKGVNLRACIESGLVARGNRDALKNASIHVLDACADYERFIFGCGIVSYDTPPSQVLLLKTLVSELAPLYR